MRISDWSSDVCSSDLDLWANARGFTCRNGSHVPGLLYHHALAELLGDRAPQCFGTVRHRNFGISIAFYSPFDLDALRRPNRGRGTADIENSMKFNRIFCIPAPTFKDRKSTRLNSSH